MAASISGCIVEGVGMSLDRGFRAGRSSATALLIPLVLAACATPAPPAAPPPVVATVTPVEKPVAPPRPPPPVRPIDLRWAFSAAPGLCTALASGPGGSLQIQSTTAGQITLMARFASAGRPTQRARPAKLSFAGTAGDWSVPGTWQGTAFTSTRPLDERGVASVLGLLGGGTALVTAGPLQIGSARLPPSSGDGNAWAQCPKQMMAQP